MPTVLVLIFRVNRIVGFIISSVVNLLKTVLNSLRISLLSLKENESQVPHY